MSVLPFNAPQQLELLQKNHNLVGLEKISASGRKATMHSIKNHKKSPGTGAQAASEDLKMYADLTACSNSNRIPRILRRNFQRQPLVGLVEESTY